jgi:hypothetical protein
MPRNGSVKPRQRLPPNAPAMTPQDEEVDGRDEHGRDE